MPFFSLTNVAKADLKEIGRYTQENWGRDQRDLYLRMLDVSFQQLADNPLKGKDCSDIRSGYRRYSAGSHVIFYRQQSSSAIEVVRILHGRMKISTRLSTP